MPKDLNELMHRINNRDLDRGFEGSSYSFTRSLEDGDQTSDDEKLYLRMTLTSETPVEDWFGFLILDHSQGSIDTKRLDNKSASWRDGHWGAQVGFIQDYEINKKRKLEVGILHSPHNPQAGMLYREYRDKYRKNASARFRVLDIRFEKEVDGKEYYRAIKWELIHGAYVEDGADYDVGIDRSNNSSSLIIPLDLAENPEKTIETFNRENKNGLQIKLITKQRSEQMPPELSQEDKDRLFKEENDRITAAVKTAGEQEGRRIASITSCARDFQALLPKTDLNKLATEFIESRDKTYQDFFDKVRSLMKEPDAMKPPESRVGMSDKEVNAYSIRNLILYQMGKVKEDDVKLELDAHRALVDKGVKPQTTKGILLPDEIQNRRREININRLTARERDLVIGTNASGGYLKRDQYIPQSFIELLQNSMAFFRAGVDVITGLVGDVPMNRELDNYTYYHVGEGSGPTKSSITFSQEKMSPKKAGVLAKYSYEFLMQSGIAVEAYVERKLAIACALGADLDIGYGTGTSYQPKGLKNWTGVTGVEGANFTRSKAITMEGQLYTGNAQDLGTMKWLSKGTTRGTLKDKKVDEGSGIFLCNDQNQMIGLDYSIVSNQIASGDLLLGTWNQILVGFWNQFEIAANPFGDDEFAAGDVKVRALQALDVFVLNPGAFSVAEGVN